MSEYAIYKMFDGCNAPYNVEFCGHLVGSRIWTGDDDPTALMAREYVRNGWHTEPPSDGRMSEQEGRAFNRAYSKWNAAHQDLVRVMKEDE